MKFVKGYKGWFVFDRGEGSHPITERFVAIRFGVQVSGGSMETLKHIIDMRIAQYPSSMGA